MRHPILPAAAVAALILSAGGAAAQTCLGLPTRDGQIAVGGVGGSFDGETQYGAEFAADVTGPAAFAIGYGGMGAEGDRQLFTGRASYDFFLLEPAVCGVAGVLFDDAPAPGIESRFGVPVGLGIGKELRGRGFSATVFAAPQYVWLREKRQVTVPGGVGPVEETESSSEFMAEAGVTLALFPVYIGGSVLVTTFDDSDPGLRLRLGLVF